MSESQKKKAKIFETKQAREIIGSEQHKCVWAAIKHNARTMLCDWYPRKIFIWDSKDWNDKIKKTYP